jgi:hypothetical protein
VTLEVRLDHRHVADQRCVFQLLCCRGEQCQRLLIAILKLQDGGSQVKGRQRIGRAAQRLLCDGERVGVAILRLKVRAALDADPRVEPGLREAAPKSCALTMVRCVPMVVVPE